MPPPPPAATGSTSSDHASTPTSTAGGRPLPSSRHAGHRLVPPTSSAAE
jgi:hypothetical protein